MQYVWKPEEWAWLVGTAVGTVILEALVLFDPSTITDWKLWLVGLGAGCIRAAAGALIAALAKQKVHG